MLTELTIGLTVVSMGTSTPELVVTADAALVGLGDIAVGNVVGSNIYNLAFVLGVVSLIRVIPVERSLVHRDGIALVASTLLGAAALFDLVVTRIEGVVLVGSLVLYTAYLLRTSATDDGEPGESGESGEPGESGESATLTTGLTERAAFGGRDGLLLVGGLVLVSGHVMVESASGLAWAAGLPEWVIGGTIVAAGTSTPEFAVSLVAMRQGSVGVSVGNVVGSNVFNLLGIMGLGAAIQPLVVSPSALESVA